MVVLMICGVLLAREAPGADSLKTLAPVYRHWVEAEVTYIISTPERKEFLALRSDVERDRFIEAFWRVRNPDPRSEINPYKEEHYRRLAYVNRTFGVEKYDEGWRTDMGRIYITLGAPKQRAPYHLTANIREMEIWFYQGSTPALPPYFYVLFFKKGSGEEYRLYSPRQDGPQALTSTGQQDTKAALKIIKNGLGNEVARTTLSLYPTEPVDLDDPQPSFESDLLLNTIRNLPDSPMERQRIELQRSQERVTASILNPGGGGMEMGAAVFRDAQGRSTAHLLLRNAAPNSRLVGALSPKETGYKMTLRTVVRTEAGKPVFEQEEVLGQALAPGQLQTAQQKVFAAEDRLPVVPGTYEVESTLTNNLTLEAVRSRTQLVVPERRESGLGLSQLVVYAARPPVRDAGGELPFSVSSLRFVPRGVGTASIHQGEKVPLLFQVWLPRDHVPPTLHLHYLYGLVASSKTVGESNEDVQTKDADAEGNLVSGHTLDTVDLPVGTYRVVVGVSGEQLAPAYSTLTLHVVEQAMVVESWTAYGPSVPLQVAEDDLKRGLAAEAQGRVAEAEHWYAVSLKENAGQTRALDRLASVLAAEHEQTKLAALANQPLLRTATDLTTVLLVADALRGTGDLKGASTLLRAQMEVQAPNAELYSREAVVLEALGDGRGAAELRAQALKVKP